MRIETNWTIEDQVVLPAKPGEAPLGDRIINQWRNPKGKVVYTVERVNLKRPWLNLKRPWLFDLDKILTQAEKGGELWERLSPDEKCRLRRRWESFFLRPANEEEEAIRVYLDQERWREIFFERKKEIGNQ